MPTPTLSVIGSNQIKPTHQLTWIAGMGKALASIGATQSDKYSWIARVGETYVITAELDHQDKANNRYDHMSGVFHKKVRPISSEAGDATATIRHAGELYDAIKSSLDAERPCRLLIVKGTQYGTSAGGVKGAVDASPWAVRMLEGSTDQGFEFILERC